MPVREFNPLGQMDDTLQKGATGSNDFTNCKLKGANNGLKLVLGSGFLMGPLMEGCLKAGEFI